MYIDLCVYTEVTGHQPNSVISTAIRLTWHKLQGNVSVSRWTSMSNQWEAKKCSPVQDSTFSFFLGKMPLVAVFFFFLFLTILSSCAPLPILTPLCGLTLTEMAAVKSELLRNLRCHFSSGTKPTYPSISEMKGPHWPREQREIWSLNAEEVPNLINVELVRLRFFFWDARFGVLQKLKCCVML